MYTRIKLIGITSEVEVSGKYLNVRKEILTEVGIKRSLKVTCERIKSIMNK
jgi:hypothetical protein